MIPTTSITTGPTGAVANTERRRRVLVIEDNPLNLELVTAILEARGYETLCASAAPEGLALAADEHPDLVITDVLLPGMSDYEAAEHLRRNPLTRNIPILALTAFAMPDERARAKAAGCDHYLSKPIGAELLVETVTLLLARTEPVAVPCGAAAA
jgi:CheY-like chemotaxis protein